jgi:hypothetical protein
MHAVRAGHYVALDRHGAPGTAGEKLGSVVLAEALEYQYPCAKSKPVCWCLMDAVVILGYTIDDPSIGDAGLGQRGLPSLSPPAMHT